MNLSDYLVSLIRTGVAVVMGVATSWAVRHGLDISGLGATVTPLAIVGYYALVRALEQRWPALGTLLGLPVQPTYQPTAAPEVPQVAEARRSRPVGGIVVINKSTMASSIDVQQAAAACAQQIAQHVAPAWGRVPMTVTFGATAPAGSWPIFVFDHADQAGALGYHDETPDGHPYGKVFVADCRNANVSLSSCLSHEVCEAFIDPACNLWADTGHHTAIAYEVGDPVEDGSYTVNVSGKLIEVSNFVLPAWFDPRATGKVDWLGQLSGPFQRTAGGYVIIEKEGKVTQQFGKAYSRTRRAAKKHPAARTARRSKQGA